MTESILKSWLQSAYRKLKSEAYFDKYQQILRSKIANTDDYSENGNAIDKIINELIYYLSYNDDRSEALETKYLNSIKYLVFPKSYSVDENNATIVYPNNRKLDKLQFMFDADIPVFILGVLWVMYTGIKLDKVCDKNSSKHSFGSRIRKRFKKDDINHKSDEDSALLNSPYLFEPYFEQYESWRDGALTEANHILDNGFNVILVMMDITRYYYSVDMSEEQYNDFIKFNDDNKPECKYELKVIEKLNTFVFKAIKKYSEKTLPDYRKTIGELDNLIHSSNDNIMLPIGFHPSKVLANIYMSKFDKFVNDMLGVSYYGRYVDDLLFIFKVDKDSIIDNFSHDNIIKNFFTKCRKLTCEDMTKDSYICSKECNNDKCKKFECNLLSIIEREEESKDCTKKIINYKINPMFFKTYNSNLILQNEKMKIIKLNADEPRILIENFKKMISDNKRAFNYMPEEDVFESGDSNRVFNYMQKEVNSESGHNFLSSDMQKVFQIKYSDTVNKLRSIDNFEIDKYELSKFLGKEMKKSIMIDHKDNKFADFIVNVFKNGTVILEHNNSWEKIIVLLLSYKKYKKVAEFIAIIVDRIEESKYDVLSKSIEEEKRQKLSAKELKKVTDLESKLLINLKDVFSKRLESIICSAFSLFWGKEYRETLENILKKIKFKENNNIVYSKYSEITSIRNNYLKTRMSNNYLVATPIVVNLKLNDNIIELDLTKLMYIINYLSLQKAKQKKYKLLLEPKIDTNYLFYPYIINPREIVSVKIMEQILQKDKKQISYDQNYIIKLFKSINFSKAGNPSNNTNITSDIKTSLDSDSSRKTTKISMHIISDYTDNNIKADTRATVKVAIANTRLDVNNLTNRLKAGGSPNLSAKRYSELTSAINEAIRQKVDIIYFPELFLPFEWLRALEQISEKNQIAIITGIEYLTVGENVSNVTASIFPFKVDEFNYSISFLHTKVHYAPDEAKTLKKYYKNIIKGNSYELFIWKNIYLTTFCCYEFASISDRTRFYNLVDIFGVVEWNKDINYFSDIIGSLTRDIHSYCIQVNNSEYGDSRVTQPTKNEARDIIKVKGGQNTTILIDDVDIKKLREFQANQMHSDFFKPLPPDFDKELVKAKITNNHEDINKFINIINDVK